MSITLFILLHNYQTETRFSLNQSYAIIVRQTVMNGFDKRGDNTILILIIYQMI